MTSFKRFLKRFSQSETQFDNLFSPIPQSVSPIWHFLLAHSSMSVTFFPPHNSTSFSLMSFTLSAEISTSLRTLTEQSTGITELLEYSYLYLILFSTGNFFRLGIINQDSKNSFRLFYHWSIFSLFNQRKVFWTMENEELRTWQLMSMRKSLNSKLSFFFPITSSEFISYVFLTTRLLFTCLSQHAVRLTPFLSLELLFLSFIF